MVSLLVMQTLILGSNSYCLIPLLISCHQSRGTNISFSYRTNPLLVVENSNFSILLLLQLLAQIAVGWLSFIIWCYFITLKNSHKASRKNVLFPLIAHQPFLKEKWLMRWLCPNADQWISVLIRLFAAYNYSLPICLYLF